MSRRAGPSRTEILAQKRKKTLEEEYEASDLNGGDSKNGVRRVIVAEEDISEEAADLNGGDSKDGVRRVVVAKENISDEESSAASAAEEDDDIENLEGSGGDEDGGDDSREASEEEEELTMEPRTFLAQPYKPYDQLAVEYFNGQNVSKEARDLVESGKKGFYGMGKKGGKGKQFPLNKFLEWLDDGVNEMVRGYVGGGGARREEVGSVIIFGTLSFDQLLDKEYKKKYRNDFNETMKLIWGELPATIPIITCFGSGVIANVPKENPRNRGIVQSSLELESDELPFLAGLVIPKVEGLGIKNFVVTKEQCNGMQGKISLKKCKEVLGITSENEKDLKGLIFFHTCVGKWTDKYVDSPAVKVVHNYLKANPHVAMAGGIHETLLSNGTADADVVACGFLIFGKDNRVRVSCAALTQPEMSTDNKLQFNKLKTTLMVAENDDEDVSSFALMFCCKERGIRMHGRANVQPQYFNEIFPNTRLVGGFDLGEFYREVLVHHPKAVKLPPPARIHFIHVSVFLLVSYRHPTI